MSGGLKRRALLVLALVGVLSPFQNCAKFKAKEGDLFSAQCQAKLRAEAPSLHLTAADLGCGDFNNYACERRIFSPDVANMVHQLKQCVGSGDICVDVEIRQFNTYGAAGATGADYAPGGTYNHEEDSCYHKMIYQGVSLFQGAGDSLEESLAKAMAACEQAVGS
jgi:hypothetical protein